MSSQKGNLNKKGPQKHQNKRAWKNVYHDTTVQTKRIVATEVSGVCKHCKDIIDWRIKYKKFKLLTQAKTCVGCKQRTVKQSYNVYCANCSKEHGICAKCGEKNQVVMKPSLSEAEQASQDRRLQFELESLPERKRRSFLRLQTQGKLVPGMKISSDDEDEDDCDESQEDEDEEEEECDSDNESDVNFTKMKNCSDKKTDGDSQSVENNVTDQLKDTDIGE